MHAISGQTGFLYCSHPVVMNASLVQWRAKAGAEHQFSVMPVVSKPAPLEFLPVAVGLQSNSGPTGQSQRTSTARRLWPLELRGSAQPQRD